ncbi:MAG TPA: anti-sigma factor [Solirubrobacteraceae bacterium]
MSTEHPRAHDGCGEDAAPYVLGALTDSEHAAYVAHLRSCASCREEVAALQSVANSLPSAVPPTRAPDHLRDRVMSTVHSEAELRTDGRERPGRARRRAALRLPWRLSFASLAATAAGVLIAVLLLGGGSGSSTRVIRAQVSAASASATLRLSSDRGTLVLAGMPKTPPGKVYEVWLKRSGAPQPTDALFTVSSAGTATVGVPGSLAGVKAVLVTAEPAGGSRVPTSAPVIQASL